MERGSRFQQAPEHRTDVIEDRQLNPTRRHSYEAASTDADAGVRLCLAVWSQPIMAAFFLRTVRRHKPSEPLSPRLVQLPDASMPWPTSATIPRTSRAGNLKVRGQRQFPPSRDGMIIFCVLKSAEWLYVVVPS